MTVITNSFRNGVDTEQLFGTLDLIKAQPELARFQFRATNRWINGAHNRSSIKEFYAAGGEDTSPAPTPGRMADFRIPQRGVFAIGRASFR